MSLLVTAVLMPFWAVVLNLFWRHKWIFVVWWLGAAGLEFYDATDGWWYAIFGVLSLVFAGLMVVDIRRNGSRGTSTLLGDFPYPYKQIWRKLTKKT